MATFRQAYRGVRSMKSKGSRKGSSEKGVTLIAANTEVSGDVHFVNQLYINGHIKGNVTADDGTDATVIVSDEGAVTGEIRVPNVVVNGRVEGNIYAAGRMELAAKAEVKGNVYYKLIEMQLGAMVDGQMVHDDTLGSGKPNVHPFPENQESASKAE
jgi:cytoskeletal protein CcmA (bactofilin family)